MLREEVINYKSDLAKFFKYSYRDIELIAIGNRVGIPKVEYYTDTMLIPKVVQGLLDLIFEDRKRVNRLLGVLKNDSEFQRSDLPAYIAAGEKLGFQPEKVQNTDYTFKEEKELRDLYDSMDVWKNDADLLMNPERLPGERRNEADGVSLKKNLKAIIIGVGHYEQGNGENDLPNAVKDARCLAHFLENNWSIDPKNICQMTMSVECKSALQEIEEFCSSLEETDHLLFYFAGHGEEIRGHSYLLMTDTILRMDKDGEKAAENALSLEWLNAMLRTCKAKLKIRIFDACHCGERFSRKLELMEGEDTILKRIEELQNCHVEDLEREMENSHEEPVSRTFVSDVEPAHTLSRRLMNDMLTKEKGWITFCSCSIDECSYDFPALGHGIFTYYLILGLMGKARRGDGPIQIEDLKIYVCGMVPKTMHNMQHPQYQCEVEGNIIVE